MGEHEEPVDQPVPPLEEERADPGEPEPMPTTIPRSVQIIDELVAEYRELSKKYPQPNLRDVFADSRWVDEVFASGVFVPYRRKYIAVADRQVRGTGDTDIATRVAAANAHHLHPDRFWVTYIESPDDFFFDPADH